MANNYIVNIVFIGDKTSGKTSLFKKFVERDLDRVNSDSFSCLDKNIGQCGSHTFTLKVWDTFGEEKYHRLVLDFCRRAIIAILVIDAKTINDGSYGTAQQKIRDYYRSLSETCPHCGIIIVINKCLLPTVKNTTLRELEEIVNGIKESGVYASYIYLNDLGRAKIDIEMHIRSALTDPGLLQHCWRFDHDEVRTVRVVEHERSSTCGSNTLLPPTAEYI